jgi:hypothetical protein
LGVEKFVVDFNELISTLGGSVDVFFERVLLFHCRGGMCECKQEVVGFPFVNVVSIFFAASFQCNMSIL